MNNKERIVLLKLTRKVLVMMKEQVGDLILKYIEEHGEEISDFKLSKLKARYEATGGSADMLISKIFPKRVKFYQNGTFSRIAMMNTIIGAEEFLLVYDYETEKLMIEERPKVSPQAL